MAFTICSTLLSQTITPSCDNPILTGIESVGVIINRDDIDLGSVVKNATKKNVIETLAIKSGKKGYQIYIPSNTPLTVLKLLWLLVLTQINGIAK